VDEVKGFKNSVDQSVLEGAVHATCDPSGSNTSQRGDNEGVKEILAILPNRAILRFDPVHQHSVETRIRTTGRFRDQVGRDLARKN